VQTADFRRLSEVLMKAIGWLVVGMPRLRARSLGALPRDRVIRRGGGAYHASKRRQES